MLSSDSKHNMHSRLYPLRPHAFSSLSTPLSSIFVVFMNFRLYPLSCALVFIHSALMHSRFCSLRFHAFLSLSTTLSYIIRFHTLSSSIHSALMHSRLYPLRFHAFSSLSTQLLCIFVPICFHPLRSRTFSALSTPLSHIFVLIRFHPFSSLSTPLLCIFVYIRSSRMHFHLHPLCSDAFSFPSTPLLCALPSSRRADPVRHGPLARGSDLDLREPQAYPRLHRHLQV